MVIRNTYCHLGHPMFGDNLRIQPNGNRRCQECHKIYERDRKKRRRQEYLEANPKPEKVIPTHCIKGHPLEGDNLYIGPNGERRCRACRNLNERDRRIRKPETLEIDRLWRENNREKRSIAFKVWYENNKERSAATSKIWRESNKERMAFLTKTWRENNKERVAASTKAWRKENPEKHRLYEQRRRAIKYGATATLTDKEWAETWQEFDGRCFWCGDVATTMEHIIPLRPRPGGLQGHHTKINVVPACSPCNNSKLNMDPLEFYFRRQEN